MSSRWSTQLWWCQWRTRDAFSKKRISYWNSPVLLLPPAAGNIDDNDDEEIRLPNSTSHDVSSSSSIGNDEDDDVTAEPDPNPSSSGHVPPANFERRFKIVGGIVIEDTPSSIAAEFRAMRLNSQSSARTPPVVVHVQSNPDLNFLSIIRGYLRKISNRMNSS